MNLYFLAALLFPPLAVLQAAEPVTNSIGMKLVPIQPGTFTMGQDGPPLEDYLRQKRFGEIWKVKDQIDFDEKPAHKVTITQPFFMGVTEVTLGQYRQFDPDFKKNNPKFKPADDDAVGGVTWEKAVAFCEWLSKKEGKLYRLPTEAEWEYAGRAGSKTAYSFGQSSKSLADYAWFTENSSKQTNPVGQKKPNAWGLCDIHGSVWEWCSDDWSGDYSKGFASDPPGPSDVSFRVNRGGGCRSGAGNCRTAYRNRNKPSNRNRDLGFRVAMSSDSDIPK